MAQRKGEFATPLLTPFSSPSASPSANARLTQRAYRRNIRKVYAQAGPIEIAYGRAWYREAGEYAAQLGKEFGVSRACAAAVIAVLSPGVDWNINKREARQVLNEEVNGVAPSYGYATYGRNVIKARQIIGAEIAELDYAEYVRGPKVTSFWRNIASPDTPNGVTVDFHAYSIATGKRYTRNNVPRFTALTYTAIAGAYASVARKLDVLPQELQAICWLAWKRFPRV